MVRTGKKSCKRTRKRRQKGAKVDLQKAIAKTGIESHIPTYNYAGPGTRLEKRLKRGDKPINRLDRIACVVTLPTVKRKI